jgi:hypothetical protein
MTGLLRFVLAVLASPFRSKLRLEADRWFPAILKVLTIIRPETLVRWHRAGFRGYWRWKSRPRGGRPQIDTELRGLVRRMSVENPLWGAPTRQQSGLHVR